MEAFLVYTVYEKFTNPSYSPSKPKTEHFTNASPSKSSTSAMSIVGLILTIIILIIFGAWAAKLSWAANSLVGWGNPVKVLFAFFAFLNGISYLFAYLIYKVDLVNYIKKTQQPSS